MTFPISYKTVFVLDQSAHFLRTSCDESFEFDLISKSRQPSGIIPSPPITKSLWTCTVEAIAEYCRIVWDIYPHGDRLIRFVSSDDSGAHTMNTWDVEDQQLASAMEAFAKRSSAVPHVKLKSGSGSYKSSQVEKSSILNGMAKAIEALCECTEVQSDKRDNNVFNRGRIIVITCFKNDASIHSIEECFLECLNEHNKLVSFSSANSEGQQKMLPINGCELVFVNTFPIGDTSASSKIMELKQHEISACPTVSCEVHSVRCGGSLAAKLGVLVLSHYDLASTTITGIPMKEEQNASSSANYDVEIVHCKEAHQDLKNSGAINAEGVCSRVQREHLQVETVTLRWCTPRTNAVELHYCTLAHRITSVDVNSRPSSCLTNFLLSGRAVMLMLELPRVKGSKIMSHMLSSHNGELYIHTLGTGRSILEDPPSISEGSGGRVTDYRINDFGDLMRKMKLVPCKPPATQKESLMPIERAKHALMRHTLYWPLAIGHTILLNMHAHVQQLLQLIPKENFTSEDMMECKKAIYLLLGLESKGTALPIPTIVGSGKGKGPKREELYRILWNELEHFLREYCVTPEHTAVLNCLLECRSKPDTQSGHSEEDQSRAHSNANGEAEKRVRSSERTFNEMKFSEMDSMGDKDGAGKEESTSKKLKTSYFDSRPSSVNNFASQSLLHFWTNKIDEKNSQKRAEFSGRLNGNGNVASLYQNLLSDKNDS